MYTKVKKTILQVEKLFTWMHCVKMVFLWLDINFTLNLVLARPVVTFIDFITNISLFGFGIICGIGLTLESDRRKYLFKKKLHILSEAMFTPKQLETTDTSPEISSFKNNERAD